MRETERINDQDLERHQRMLARLREAQQCNQQAQQLQARASQLNAAFTIWAEELHQRYTLDAARGEGILEDGTIIRHTSEHATHAQVLEVQPEVDCR